MQEVKRCEVSAHSESGWCDVKIAADHLNISTAFLRKLVRQRRIPFARLGTKALRFRRSDLDRWAEANGCSVEIAQGMDSFSATSSKSPKDGRCPSQNETGEIRLSERS